MRCGTGGVGHQLRPYMPVDMGINPCPCWDCKSQCSRFAQAHKLNHVALLICKLCRLDGHICSLGGRLFAWNLRHCVLGNPLGCVASTAMCDRPSGPSCHYIRWGPVIREISAQLYNRRCNRRVTRPGTAYPTHIDERQLCTKLKLNIGW